MVSPCTAHLVWMQGKQGEAVAVEREACAKIADTAMLVPPDGGSPTADEVAMCEQIERVIRERKGK